MKIPIIILAVLGLVCGKPLQNGSLQQEVKEFMAHFPTDKVLEIAMDYLANDEEVREFVAYIQSEEFPKIHKTVEQLQEYKDCFSYFSDQGVNVYAIINQIHDTLGYPPYQPTNTTRTGVGFYGLIDDVIAVLPLDDLAPFMGQKMESREFFKTVGAAIHSPVWMNMVDNVQSWPEYKELREILQNMVVEVQRIIELVREVYTRETQRLQEDLKEITAHFPADKVLEITLDYLANDPEFNEAYAYVQSEEFPRIHKIVEYLKQYKDCFSYINDEGVDVHAIFNQIHNTLGYPPFQPTNTTRTGVGFSGLKNDVIAALPLDELKALYYEKMETRQYFKTLVTALKSPVFKNMVNSVRTWPEYQKLLEIVREYGVDGDHITKYVWEQSLRGTRRLQHELKQFTAHFPTDKILEIAMDYLANDEEVRESVANVQSEKFPKIHKTVQQLQEYKDCFSYFNDQGVDVYAIINQIHDTLGYPPYQPTNTTRKGVGFYGLIDDVIAVLPLDDLAPFMGKKMESREFFKTLGAAIHSPVWMNMVNSAQSWPEYTELREILQNMVPAVQRTIELAWEVYMRETQSLQEDLKEFMALLPAGKVLEITLDYLANDPEFNEAYAYVQSEQFPRIHKIAEYLKQYKDCSKFINDQGVDIPAIFNKIHDTLGYPPYQPTNTTRTGVGFNGLKNDVIAALPLDDLKALYQEKMETRGYFKILVGALKSPVFKNMVDTVQAWPEFQKLLEIVREYGVDGDRITEYLWEQSLRGTRRLQHELKEFTAHFPTDKVLEIAMDYLANDEEVHESVAYIQSEEFPKIQKTVEQLQEYKDCFSYFNDQGVDVHAIVNQIHDTLGYPPYQPTNTTRTGVGFYGLIDDEIAVIPLDDLTPFVGKKMEIREFFKTVGAAITAVNSAALKNMVNSVQSWPEYNELSEILQNMFADAQQITQLVWDVYMRETQSLQENLKEFMALVPTDKVFEITLDYLANDPQFHEAYVYIQSEEFPRIHNIVEYLKQYKDCFNFTNDEGVDVPAIVNKIHDTLGYPPHQPTNTTRTGVGYYGLKDDVIAALPLDELKALYYEKMETREYYKTLVRALKSPALQNIMETLRARPEYQKLLQTLRQMADRSIEYFRAQFGVHSPHNRTSEYGE